MPALPILLYVPADFGTRCMHGARQSHSYKLYVEISSEDQLVLGVQAQGPLVF
jgi:hypothetical protein